MAGPANHMGRESGSVPPSVCRQGPHLAPRWLWYGDCIRTGSENEGRETSGKAVIGTQVRTKVLSPLG